MTQNELAKWINELIAKDELYKFYQWRPWRRLAKSVMKENNNECQYCKMRGIHTAARSVHHVKYIREYPYLALSRTYEADGEIHNNLIPLCEECHNKVHGKNTTKGKQKKDRFVNEERW